jgi:prolyl oligopeptidase
VTKATPVGFAVGNFYTQPETFRATGNVKEPVMNWTTRIGALALMSLLGAAWMMADDPVLKYPQTKRDTTVDEYHGARVPDPYRWLEDDVRKSKNVADWVKAENEITEAYLKAIPEREAIRKRLSELWNYEKMSAPFKAGGRYFFFKNDGLQAQSVLYTQDSLNSEARVLLDPNTWSKDGTIALAEHSLSDDGKYIAYSKSEAGSDWHTWYVMEIATNHHLSDELKWVKFSGASWTADNRGFFYARYDQPPKGQEFQDVNENQKLMYHRIGTPQSDDVLVYKRPDHPDWSFGGSVSEDGRYLIISTFRAADSKNRVAYRDLTEPYAMPIDLVEDFENEFSFLGNDGQVFFFKTDFEAPKGRVIAVDVRKPERANWKEIIPEAQEKLEGISLVGNCFVTTYLKDAHTRVKVFSVGGEFIRDVDFPTIGTASGFGGKRTDTETFYTFSSFNTPGTTYRYDLLTGKTTLFRKSKAKVNPDDYEVKLVFVTSKDGTKVPLFITSKKGVKLDGSNPTLLYGYGGFNVSLTPSFSIANLGWLEMGGVYAQAVLRGGGEYGEEWHQAGAKDKKQNVFDDFAACAEYLIKEKWTTSEKLSIMGGSNGGLLVGAMLTQRPELFAAAIPKVGVMDMLRYHKFTAGRYWTEEYGSSDDPQQFQTLLAYSPYHNIEEGKKYPATLVTTADTDDRVVPGHSFKFLAALQNAQGGSAPILGRIETSAGHGAGKPTQKIIDEYADQWAFLVKNLKMKLPTR